jgi:hypothetical protein
MFPIPFLIFLSIELGCSSLIALEAHTRRRVAAGRH